MKVWKRSLPVWLLTLVMLLTACGTPSQPDRYRNLARGI